MNHSEASRLLSDHAAGRLSPARSGAVGAHIKGCRECRGWVATYEILAGSVAEVSLKPHLSSQELCDFALEAPALGRNARKRCEHHLAACSECSEEVALVRSAVREAGEAPVPLPGFLGRSRQLASSKGGRLALAAALVLVASGLVAVSHLKKSASEELRLVGESVGGNRSIKASRSILVEAMKIVSGSEVNLESEVIAFGNGFSIESGAGLAVVTNRISDENDASRGY
jgi:anti-sigma factor RsiW